MLKKTVFAAIFFILGFVIGGFGVMAYYGHNLAHGMLMLQEGDIVRTEEAAVKAFENESVDAAIWAMEYYLNFVDDVFKTRADAIEKENLKQHEIFLFFRPTDKWSDYLRLGLLYEEKGHKAKKEELFQKAAEIQGRGSDEAYKQFLTKFADKIKSERTAHRSSLGDERPLHD